jgi:hypothetical protein
MLRPQTCCKLRAFFCRPAQAAGIFAGLKGRTSSQPLTFIEKM